MGVLTVRCNCKTLECKRNREDGNISFYGYTSFMTVLLDSCIRLAVDFMESEQGIMVLHEAPKNSSDTYAQMQATRVFFEEAVAG